MLLVYYGFTVECLQSVQSTLSAMWFLAKIKSLGNEQYSFDQYLELTPGQQYRMHMRKGGYRI
jgi:hypothetical protein